jgi:hypothetical protein
VKIARRLSGAAIALSAATVLVAGCTGSAGSGSVSGSSPGNRSAVAPPPPAAVSRPCVRLEHPGITALASTVRHAHLSDRIAVRLTPRLAAVAAEVRSGHRGSRVGIWAQSGRRMIPANAVARLASHGKPRPSQAAATVTGSPWRAKVTRCVKVAHAAALSRARAKQQAVHARRAAKRAEHRGAQRLARQRAAQRRARERAAMLAQRRAERRRRAAAPPPATSCTRTSTGSCIQGGDFCPQASYGDRGTDADGDVYTCTGDRVHPHWE